MTELEKQWIDRCKRSKDEYVIIVDNDCAFVVSLKEQACVFDFGNYGWQLALDLFQYIGCNAEEA